MVDPALWQLPDGTREVSYKFLSEANTLLGAGKLDGAGQSARLFTEAFEAAAVGIDLSQYDITT